MFLFSKTSTVQEEEDEAIDGEMQERGEDDEEEREVVSIDESDGSLGPSLGTKRRVETCNGSHDSDEADERLKNCAKKPSKRQRSTTKVQAKFKAFCFP
jgi:hypothetical protein